MKAKKQAKKTAVKKNTKAYFSKRVLVRAVSKATKDLSEEAIQSKGFVVTVKDGWVVREAKDGTQTRISRIPRKTSKKYFD